MYLQHLSQSSSQPLGVGREVSWLCSICYETSGKDKIKLCWLSSPGQKSSLGLLGTERNVTQQPSFVGLLDPPQESEFRGNTSQSPGLAPSMTEFQLHCPWDPALKRGNCGSFLKLHQNKAVLVTYPDTNLRSVFIAVDVLANSHQEVSIPLCFSALGSTGGKVKQHFLGQESFVGWSRR